MKSLEIGIYSQAPAAAGCRVRIEVVLELPFAKQSCSTMGPLDVRTATTSLNAHLRFLL